MSEEEGEEVNGPKGHRSQAGWGGGRWRSLACSPGSGPSPRGQVLGTERAQSPGASSSIPPCPPPASFPPLASLPWAQASAPSWPPDTASSSSDIDSGLRSFCAHCCRLLCARPVLGEQGELGRGLVGKAAKHHVQSHSTSSCFLPRAPARRSRASPAILCKAPGLAPCSVTPRIIRGLVWTTLLSIWPVKLRASRQQTCVSRVAQCLLLTQPAAPKPLELSKRLRGLEPRLTSGVWSQEEGSLKLRGKSRHSTSSQPSFGVVSDRSAWNSL